MDTLEDDVRRIVKSINNTRGECPSPKLCEARKILKSGMKCPIDKRVEMLLASLRKTAEMLDETRRECHSKQLKAIREDIAEVLKDERAVALRPSSHKSLNINPGGTYE